MSPRICLDRSPAQPEHDSHEYHGDRQEEKPQSVRASKPLRAGIHCGREQDPHPHAYSRPARGYARGKLLRMRSLPRGMPDAGGRRSAGGGSRPQRGLHPLRQLRRCLPFQFGAVHMEGTSKTAPRGQRLMAQEDRSQSCFKGADRRGRGCGDCRVSFSKMIKQPSSRSTALKDSIARAQTGLPRRGGLHSIVSR